MSVSRIVSIVALACVGIMPPVALAQVPTADDFLPVVQGGPSDVKQPQQVAVKGKVVSAATAQDAINAAVGENVKGLKNSDTPKSARRWSSIRAVWASWPVALRPTAPLRIPP